MIARPFLRLRIGMTSVAIIWCVLLVGACNGDGTEPVLDADGDGFAASADCDDEDASIHPSAAEHCNAIDDDCDGDVDEGVLLTFYVDADHDTYGSDADMVAACSKVPGAANNRLDCDDSDPEVNPDATEVCANGKDDDCDGQELATQTWYADADDDGYGDPATTDEWCDARSGFVDDATDCDDSDAAVHPGAEELCDNTIDDDCDDVVASSADADHDGWYADACVGGFDCDDGDATIHPGAVETCDEIDSDCNGNDCSLDDRTICSSELGEPDTVLPAFRGSCEPEDGFFEFGGQCYLFVESGVEWGIARANCIQAGGYLATVADEDENAFITELATNSWLGACDADEEGVWTWITGEPWAYENWDPGEPNDLDGEHCLGFWNWGVTWNDYGCGHPPVGESIDSYVCEFELADSP